MTVDDYADVYTTPEPPPRVTRTRFVSGREERRLERIGIDPPATPAPVTPAEVRNSPPAEVRNSVTPRYVRPEPAVYACPDTGSRLVCLTCGRPAPHYVAFLLRPGQPVPLCETHGRYLVKEANQ